MLKILRFLLLLVTAVLLPRWCGFAKAVVPHNLDELATLDLPKSFHREPSRELALPAARRLLRKPYRELHASADQLTYYLPSHDYTHLGGREIPALLRVTLYADDAPLRDELDSAYVRFLTKQNFHYDGQLGDVFARLQPAGGGLWYAANPQTRPGWFSVTEYTLMHLLLTDVRRKVRLLLSVSDREMSRAQAEALLRRALQSLTREPAGLARYFAYVRHFRQHQTAIEQANAAENLRGFNQQLTAAGLPPLEAADLYGPGRYVDVGPFFYGVNSWQEVFFAARLGTSTQAIQTTEPYFTNVNPDGRYLPSAPQEAIFQQDVPPGRVLQVRSSVSESLWFPPEEFAHFQLADLLRETAESVARVSRNPGFAPLPRTPPARWLLSQVYSDRVLAEAGSRTDYRRWQIRFPNNIAPTQFTLCYLGTRTLDQQPPTAVFTLTSAAATLYVTVDAARGGELDVTVAGTPCRIRIEPPTLGHLTIELNPAD